MSANRINDAIRMTGMTPVELWMGYLAVGGNLPPDVLQTQLAAGQLDHANRNALIETLNDWFVERGHGRPLR